MSTGMCVYSFVFMPFFFKSKLVAFLYEHICVFGLNTVYILCFNT